MQRYAALMHDELQQRGHRVQLLRPSPIANRRAAPPAGVAKWLGYLDKFVLFPRRLKRAARRADIVHICDHSNAIYTRVLRGQPHLVTCHDVLAIRSALGQIPENPTGRSGRWLQRWIVNGLDHAQHVVCDSQQTRDELLQISRLKPPQTQVTYIGFNYPYRPLDHAQTTAIFQAALDPRTASIAESGRYLLHIGADQWYKNRAGVLRIYQHLQGLFASAPDQAPFLIMAGSPLPAALRDYIAHNDLSERVLTVENCRNETLQALYSRAQALLFPSLAEGFGWPVIEAQACGCSVATSQIAPLTELGAETAVYFDPRDEAAAAQIVRQLLEETPARKSERVKASLDNAARFSNQTMIDEYLETYRKLLD